MGAGGTGGAIGQVPRVLGAQGKGWGRFLGAGVGFGWDWGADSACVTLGGRGAPSSWCWDQPWLYPGSLMGWFWGGRSAALLKAELEPVPLPDLGGLSPANPNTPQGGSPGKPPCGAPQPCFSTPLQILVLWSCEEPPPPLEKWPQITVPLSVIEGRREVRGAGTRLEPGIQPGAHPKFNFPPFCSPATASSPTRPSGRTRCSAWTRTAASPPAR